MIGRRIGRWLDRRLGLAPALREGLRHVFPDHWSFMLGEIALYCFVILVITGAFLGMFFHASDTKETYHGAYEALRGIEMSAAYRSVLDLSFEVPAGLLIRQMHHWAADLFIAAIVVHLLRIFFTAAYRRPREINWLIGLTLLLLALANGYFGYSILGDLLSGAGLRIGYAILLSVPVVGQWLAYVAFGGNIPAHATIPRLYTLHIFVLPAAIGALLALHLAVIWRQLHTNLPGPRRTDATIVGSRLWPSYAAKSIGLFCLLLAVVAGLGGWVQIDPIWIYGPYDPIAIVPGAQPDWYLGWVEGAMRLFPGVHVRLGPYLVSELFFPAMLLPMLVFAALYAFPFVEQWLTGDRQRHGVLRLPTQQPLATALGCAVLAMMAVLLLAGGDDVIAVALGGRVAVIRWWLRLLFFLVPALVGGTVWLLCRRAERQREASRAPAALASGEPAGG